MQTSAFYEKKSRGTNDFPVEFHDLTPEQPRYEMPFHWHREIELIRVLRGEFCISLDGTEHRLTAGDTVFLQGGVIHGGSPSDCDYQCIVADLEELTGGKSLIKQDPALFRVPPGSLAGKILCSVFETLKNRPEGYEWTTKGLLLQWIGALLEEGGVTVGIPSQDNSKNTLRLKNALRYIRKHYAEPISLAQIAEAAELSPNYLCRSFRTLTGKTPVEYLNYYRIEKACQLLRESDLSVTEIAFECGFNDLSYFIRIFRRCKETSPKRYRTQN